MSLLPCRATITNLLCACSRSHLDWSADYRLYSQERVEPRLLFAEVLAQAHARLDAQSPLVAAIDDTLVRKTGARIDGVGWKRDPAGPKFQTNLVRGQRYLQLSAAWPTPTGRAHMLPVNFTHAPPAPKPGKNATQARKQACKEQQKQRCLNHVAQTSIKELRDQLPPERKLVITGDGSYTNAHIIKTLPPNTTYIGRLRRDAVLHHPPDGEPAQTGRPKLYGTPAPTPETLRQDPNTPWTKVSAHAAGKTHEFKIKASEVLLWRKTGAATPLRVMVIAPLGYRLRKGSKLLYRQAAYLVCTDPDMPLEHYLQYYLWRWGIEVNFRDEKTLFGVGQAQVRTEPSNRNVPASAVAAYALLWLAALQADETGQAPPRRPKWQKSKHPGEMSTADLIKQMRNEHWAGQINEQSFSHFKAAPPLETSDHKPQTSLAHAVLSTS
jgi:hypothetical protein